MLQGDPKENLLLHSNGYGSENLHFRPHVGRTEMCLGDPSLFSFFSCLFTIFSFMLSISKNLVHQNTLWLYQHGVKYAYFCIVAFWCSKFWFGSPCIQSVGTQIILNIDKQYSIHKQRQWVLFCLGYFKVLSCQKVVDSAALVMCIPFLSAFRKNFSYGLKKYRVGSCY